MRSVSIKATKRDAKPANKKPVPAKKKKMTELKSPIRDTISETISFVIKGKLTPIKPIMIDSKLDLVTKVKNKPQKCGKIVKNRSCKKPAGKQMIKKQEVNSKVKAKVQIKAAKKPSAQIIKKTADKILTEVLPATPKGKPKKVTKPTKKKPTIKIVKEKKPPVPKVKTQVSQIKKIIIKKAPVRKEGKNKAKENPVKVEPDTQAMENKTEDDIKKQQTIEKLLKQASKQLKSKTIKGKLKKANAKHGGDIQQTQKQPKGQQVKETIEESKKSELNASPDYTSDEIPLKELSQRPKENPEQSPSQHKASREVVAETPPKPSPKQKIKPKPKTTMIKKRVVASKSRLKSKDEKRKSKLFSFWNGPKRHRVASLNALAKVHCLYENETRGNILDILDEDGPKREYNPKKDTRTIKKEPNIKVESDDDTEDKSSSEEAVTPPTRTLRCVPGLRAIGKHWDMHDTSSSSEDNSDESGCESVPVTIKKEKAPQQRQETDKQQEEATKEKPRRRNRNEVIMDLKDMVVRKRMASLNASAILAASYSMEKRPARAQKDADDSSSYASGSSEEYFAASDDDTKDDDVKEEDRKLIEVHTTPNKKVAVILNQDTDVTITGVYVNSTTRSTHHEGYCSIAGMQYRISATSHTQTAATAVATETLLQSASSSNAPDNSNSDSLPSSKSYTPLDALSNMQPPPGPGIQHNHPVLHSQQHMGPPQHVLPIPPHQLSPGLRHGCSSAFSSPHSTPSYPLPPGHHPQGEPGYVHGYYQPAGPLITVPHGHGQPPPPPLTKSAPLSEASPTSTTPSASHDPPPPPSSNGDSSDSEVIITSVTTGKDSAPPPSHHPTSYRFTQYPTAPPGYSYSYPPPYHYPTPPPPNPSYAHHDLCYPPSPYVHHKYPSYRRYLSSTPYYPTNPQELYPVPPTAPSQSQQVVTTTPVSASGPAFSAPPSGPPPLMETYPAPQPTLVETYQPPPHYFSPAYGPAPPCYTHSPSRAIPYINATYQSCPCPMQSCPKNVLTGPLTGDSKRSNISSISKDSMPLPPVALALPLEPASATGPPSPARGSAGMPPPPSPAGATYQPPPPPTKQESHSPEALEDCKTEKKRKARVGKAMVRSNMQQNTMLLMCNPTTNYVSTVKREIESPKEKEVMEQKKEMCSSDEEIKIPVEETETPNLGAKNDSFDNEQIKKPMEPKAENVEDNIAEETENDDTPNEKCEEILQPIVNTVAENVKVKNMKRKLSVTKEKVPDPELSPSPRKKQRLGSYKYLIKRDTNTVVKIHNGKRKLIDESVPQQKNEQMRKVKINLKKPTSKRKMGSAKEINNKRLKMSRPLTVRNLHNNKQNSKAKDKISVEVVSEVREPLKKVAKKVLTVNSKNNSKSAPAVLDSLFARNNVDRIIESVVSEACLRTPKETSALKTVEKCGKAKEPAAQKKSTNKIGQVKVKSDCKATGASRRKSKCKELDVPQAITKSPRRSLHLPRWSNGWRWEGEPYEAKVFLNSDETTVVRTCYPAMRHEEGDKIFPRDCVLLKAGPRKNDLPFVAKIASLWENPEDGEMMMSLLWYYRPEHTEQGRLPTDQQDEVFASRHKDSNSVACIDDKCYVLTFSEYCRYRKRFKRIEEGIEETLPCIPNPEPYPRSHRQPPTSQISPEMVFFCRRVYDFRQKRIMKNPT